MRIRIVEPAAVNGEVPEDPLAVSRFAPAGARIGFLRPIEGAEDTGRVELGGGPLVEIDLAVPAMDLLEAQRSDVP